MPLFILSIFCLFVSFATVAHAQNAPPTSGDAAQSGAYPPPPHFRTGQGEGSAEYEQKCQKPALEDHYKACVVEPKKVGDSLGSVVSSRPGSGGGGGMSSDAQTAANNAELARDFNSKVTIICQESQKNCVRGCQAVVNELHQKYSAKQSCASQGNSACFQAARELLANRNLAKEAVEQCEKYFSQYITQLTGASVSSAGAAAQYKSVREKTAADGRLQKEIEGAEGGADSPKEKDKGMNPWLIGGIGAVAGGVGGYMLGSSQGEDQGYKKGKKDAEEAAKKAEEEKNGTKTTADCAKSESATKEECKQTYLSKCAKDLNAEGCGTFSDSYCKTTSPAPDAVFCRKVSATNYCSKSDSVNKTNCPSCRELSNGFSGQYSPEDLANSCAICGGDPLCATSGSFYNAYRIPSTSTNLFSNRQSTDSSPVLPNAVVFDSNKNQGFTGREASGEKTATGSTQFLNVQGQSATMQRVGANQYGIGSALGQSNFRVHSTVIQRFCQEGGIVGCGPLTGIKSSASN